MAENPNLQIVVEKTSEKSSTHRFARIWILRCELCSTTYGANSCDVHVRRCPNCQGGKPSEPTN